MKAIFKQAIAAAAIAVLGSAAHAQEIIPPFTWGDLPATTMTRDQVKAELDAARKDGSIKAVSATYDFAGRSPSTKTREQVRAELAAARASGEFDALNNEVYAFPIVPRTPVYAKSDSQSAQ